MARKDLDPRRFVGPIRDLPSEMLEERLKKLRPKKREVKDKQPRWEAPIDHALLWRKLRQDPTLPEFIFGLIVRTGGNQYYGYKYAECVVINTHTPRGRHVLSLWVNKTLLPTSAYDMFWLDADDALNADVDKLMDIIGW